MFKLVTMGAIGAFGAAIGAVMAVVQSHAPQSAAEGVESPASIESVSTELTAVPVVKDGSVTGYLVLRLSSSVDRSKIRNPDEVLAPYLSDAAFRAAFDLAAEGMTEIKAKHVERLSDEIVRIANQRFGADAVQSVRLEQFNIVPSSQVRGNVVRAE